RERWGEGKEIRETKHERRDTKHERREKRYEIRETKHERREKRYEVRETKHERREKRTVRISISRELPDIATTRGRKQSQTQQCEWLGFIGALRPGSADILINLKVAHHKKQETIISNVVEARAVWFLKSTPGHQ
ncbi:hypothetical protein LSAT2_027189, partial [Lamellibrachia satsuma]